ncbi:MAG: hypothetical protein FOGNACKC_05756 [Anaerolineae bacterium]|nr:hypothetical protein [Anaerolineae bacterium]
MSNVDVPQDNDSPEDEIESPVDGPTPDWMKMATSSSSKPSLTEENTPAWLKNIKAGKSKDEPQPATPPQSQESASTMTDLERLLAEEGVDLDSVPESRPPGAEGMSARDWMIATSDDEMIRNRVGEEPFMDTDEFDTEDPYAGMSDIERLLAEEGVDLGSVAESRPTGSEGMSARDWMISTSDDDMIRRRVGAEPLTDTSPSTPTPLPEPEEPAESILDTDLPDWLQDEAEAESGFSEPVAGSDDESFFDADLPDWLQETPDEEEFAKPAAEPLVDGMVVEDDLPDWLRDFGTEEEEPSMPSMAAESEDDKMVVEEQLPDWLRDVEEEVSAAPPVTVDLAEDDDMLDEDLPDWLRDVEEETATGEPSLALAGEDIDDKMVVDEDLPDWLQEAEAAEPEPSGIVEPVATADDHMIIEEDLPDWLRDVEEEAAEPAAETETGLPAWLENLPEEAEAEVRFEPAQPVEARMADDNLIEEDELPDWLQEVQEESGEELFETEEMEETLAEEAELDDVLPEWLAEVSVTDDDGFEPSEPSPDDLDILDEDEEDLPDWLREVQAEADLLEESEPEEVEEEEEAVEPEEEAVEVVEEELPDWLMGIEEEPEAEMPEPVAMMEAEPEPEIPVAETAEPELVAEAAEAPAVEVEAEPAIAEPEPVKIIEEAPAVATTGLPDWLKKLREGDKQPEPAPLPRPMAAPVPEPQPVARVQMAAEPVAELVEPEPADLPTDPDERLKLARTARDGGELDESVRVYGSLVSSGAHLDSVIDDLELTIRLYPANYKLYQVLGDAMMKDGRLQKSLEAYRKALEKLSS